MNKIITTIFKLPYRLFDTVLENWHVKLMSLFIALVLWVYVESLKISVINVTIPVNYINKPHDFFFSDEPPRFIEVKIRGREERLKFNTQSLKAEVDLARASEEKKYYPVFFDPQQLPEKLEVIQMPERLRLALERQIEKDLWVRPVIIGLPVSGYKRGRVTVKPDRVRVRGLRSQMANLWEVQTRPLDITSVKKSFTRRVYLKNPDNFQRIYNPEEVDISVVIFQDSVDSERKMQKIPIHINNLDPALQAFLSDQVAEVEVHGQPEAVRQLKAGDFYASVNLEGTRYNPRAGSIFPFETESGIPVDVRLLVRGRNLSLVNVTPETITVRFQVRPEFVSGEATKDSEPVEEPAAGD